MNLKAATLVTSLLQSARALGKLVSTRAQRLSSKPRLRLVRDPIGIQEPVAGALERADDLQARPKNEAEALSRASAWSGYTTPEPDLSRN